MSVCVFYLWFSRLDDVSGCYFLVICNCGWMIIWGVIKDRGEIGDIVIVWWDDIGGVSTSPCGWVKRS